MKRLLPRFLTGAFVASLGCLLALAASPARAADNEVKLVRQFGIHYLGLEQMARDIRTIAIPDGTPGILGLIQGRELTGIDAFRG